MLPRLASLGLKFARTTRTHGLREACRRSYRRLLHRLARDLRIDGLDEVLAKHSQSIRWLAEIQGRQAGTAPVPSAGRLRVSVIMPVWNRAERLAAAIESVRMQSFPDWELLVIDDGSTDQTPRVAAGYLSDPRIRYLRQEHAGVSAARNRGLAESRGDVIAYLDSDNTWYPGYLATVVAALDTQPERQSVFALQRVTDQQTGNTYIKEEADINTFAHRRNLYEQQGGFDENLKRYIDWELILRYAAVTEPVHLPVLGCRYESGNWERITNSEPCFYYAIQVRRRHVAAIDQPLRVLYALDQYPQLSETYIEAELRWMLRRGVRVEVHSAAAPAAPYPAVVPVHEGSLAQAIERFRPHLVHSHWAQQDPQRYATVAQANLPMTIRGHGFEFSPATIQALERQPAIQRIYLFPHFAAEVPWAKKVRPMRVCFNPDLHHPGAAKERRLVLRAALAKPSKAADAFMRIAQRCPNHRFLLVLCPSDGGGDLVDQLLEANRRLGSPVEIRVRLAHEEVAELSRQAGIYLHTCSARQPYGMPISIAEAMASGAYVVGRRCPASQAYIGDAGVTYAGEAEAAALILATEGWSDEQWQQAELRSSERAFEHFADVTVLEPLLQDWLELARAVQPQVQPWRQAA